MGAIPDIESRVYGGRTLVGYTDQGEHMADWPEVVHQAIRAISHLTKHGPIPAPTVYQILGELKGVGHLLPQACAQLGSGLQQSLPVLDVCDNRRDPAESVTEAVLLLNRALRKVFELGELLDAAQAAVAIRATAPPRSRTRTSRRTPATPESEWR